MQEYLALWKNYVNFKDRTSVRGYWMAVLFNIIIAFVLVFLTNVSSIFAIIYMIYGLAAILPGLGLCVRRLHDTNRSGWFILISLIPLVGGIVLLVFLCQGSNNNDNRFGTVQV